MRTEDDSPEDSLMKRASLAKVEKYGGGERQNRVQLYVSRLHMTY